MKDTQAFTGLSEIYDKARPNYPQELFRTLVNFVTSNRLDLMSSTCTIVDTGCGTGISTRALYNAFHELVVQDQNIPVQSLQVVGVDPGHDMRNTAINNTTSSIQFIEGSAENIPLADQSADLVTAAQAAHWFDRLKFYTEAQRILKPGGILAIIENNRNYQKSEFLDKYESFRETCVDPTTQVKYSRHYRDYDYKSEMAQAFGNCTVHEFEWERVMSMPDFITMAKSSSQVSNARKQLGDSVFEEKINALLNEYKDTNDQIHVLYTTVATISIKH